MRRIAAIEADIGRYNRAVDAAIDLVIRDKAMRPTRAWAMGVKVLQDRLFACEEELREAQAAIVPVAPNV